MGDSHASAIALGLVVIGFVVFWYFSVYSRTVTNAPSPNIDTAHPVVVVGGSISHSAGALQNGGYTKVLSKQLDTKIAVVGATPLSITGAWGYVPLLKDLKPRVVIVEFGSDDYAIPTTPSHDFRGRLERLVDAIHETGAAVIIVESPWYRQSARSVAREYQTAIVRDPIGPLLGNSDYMFDSQFPNDRGHEYIAQEIAPVLMDLLETE